VVMQVLGYMVSKFVGIRVIAEVRPERRVRTLLVLMGVAHLALVGFAVTPAPWQAAWLFVNGLALGMIYGLVVGYLEGRRHTEALIAALCTSFILADGVVKSVGQYLLDLGVPVAWMPSAAGGLFVLPLYACAFVLNRIPPPDAADTAARSERTAMTAADRRAALRKYGPGLALIVLMYLFVTVLRSVRADFATEIWTGLGVKPDATVFSYSEMAVAFGILLLNGSMIFVRNNRTAFFLAIALSAAGLAMTAGNVLFLEAGVLSPFAFMVLLGIGLYLPYIAVHTTLFERFIALTRDRGTLGYFMYLTDAFGYLGYVGVLLANTWWKGKSDGGILPLLLNLCLVLSLAGLLLLAPAALYFRRLGAKP
jgi:Family of unknown function (DUF5690)